MTELEKLFPMHFGTDNPAKLLKYTVVKPLRSGYKAMPDRQQCRSLQVTSASNFCFIRDYLAQRYLASMERAVLSGKLTAQAINHRQAITSQLSLAEAALTTTCH